MTRAHFDSMDCLQVEVKRIATEAEPYFLAPGSECYFATEGEQHR